jgi:CheY-like chemotaxis protein
MRRSHILVVDDEPARIKLLRANLERNGYEVLAAMDGAEALQTIERELPDLVILDIIMPNGRH